MSDKDELLVLSVELVVVFAQILKAPGLPKNWAWPRTMRPCNSEKR
jgi:hypothetical protein